MMATSRRSSYTIERYTQDAKTRHDEYVATYGPLQVALGLGKRAIGRPAARSVSRETGGLPGQIGRPATSLLDQSAYRQPARSIGEPAIGRPAARSANRQTGNQKHAVYMTPEMS